MLCGFTQAVLCSPPYCDSGLVPPTAPSVRGHHQSMPVYVHITKVEPRKHSSVAVFKNT